MGNTKYFRLDHPKIISDFKQLNNLTDVASLNGTTPELVKKVLVNYDIPLPVKIKVKDLDPTPIVNRYLETRNSAEVAKEFSISISSLYQILNNNNIKISKIGYTTEDIIEHYYKVKTIVQTSRDLNLSKTYITSILDENNVPLQVLKRVEVGSVYDYLTVIKELQPKYTTGGESKKMLLCECKCGNTMERSSASLRKTDKFKSCGCHIEERKQKNEEIRINKKLEYEQKLKEWEIKRIEKEKKKKEYIDKYGLYGAGNPKFIVGYKKDRFTITGIEGAHPNKMISVICECGTEKVLKYQTFIQSKSCGCLQVERSTKHGLAPKNDDYRRRWYDRWRGMISRCYNPKMHAYPNYGGRGIRVCDRWREPNGVGCKNYIEDIHNILGPQPSPEHSLDRMDNDGIYTIENMRWATNSQQVRNQRRNLK
jgi:hypothetical protein